jgi:hypothetical protein
MNRFAFLVLLLSSTPCVFGSDDEEKDYKMHWAAHGICASIAWAILVPLAVGSSMLRKELVKAGFSEGFWFQLHRCLNTLAAILTIIAFAIAVHVIREEDGKSPWKEYTHFIVGLVIFLVTLLQAMFGLLRPSKEAVKDVDEEDSATENKDVENKEESTGDETKETAKEEGKDKASKAENTDKESEEPAWEKSLLRIGWEVKHRFLGVGLLATAWWQLHSGWELYEEEVGGEDLGAAFLGVAGGISVIIVIVSVVQKMRA